MAKSRIRQIKEKQNADTASKSKGKNLTLSNLKKENKKKKETFEVVIRDWKLQVKSEFGKSEISQIIYSVAQATTKVRTRQADFGQVFTPYVLMLMIKHFTSLGEDISDDINQQLEVLKILIDEDLFVPIVQSFPEKEMNKVMLEIAKVADDINNTMDSLEENVENIKLKNMEIENLIIEE